MAPGRLQRVLHPVAVHYKGSGFYSTDYGRKSKKPAKDGASEGSGSSSDGGGSGDSSGSGGGDSGGSGDSGELEQPGGSSDSGGGGKKAAEA